MLFISSEGKRPKTVGKLKRTNEPVQKFLGHCKVAFTRWSLNTGELLSLTIRACNFSGKGQVVVEFRSQ